MSNSYLNISDLVKSELSITLSEFASLLTFAYGTIKDLERSLK